MKKHKFLSYEWDAIAGVLAAVIAIILHLLHIVDEAVVLPILLALLGPAVRCAAAAGDRKSAGHLDPVRA